MAPAAQPNNAIPPGSWKDSAVSPSIILHASSNGTLVPEGVANDGLQGTGSWENSAISARFFLKCQLRTCGRFARTIYQEIFPWQAYSNQDGYLVLANPPPPPPAPPAPAESLTTGQYGDGGLAHLTMQSATALPHADTAGSLQGIWGAGPAGSVSEFPEVGARIISVCAIRAASPTLVSCARRHPHSSFQPKRGNQPRSRSGTDESNNDAPLIGAVPQGHLGNFARGIRGVYGGGS